MKTQPVSIASYVRLLRQNRNFRLLWFAQIVSEIGDWLYAVAVYSLLLEYTGKAQSIALAFVLQVLPQFFTAPSAGIVNDRISRKRVMIFADWARAAIVLSMLLVRTPGRIPLLYGLLAVETVMWAFFEPGRSAVLPNIAGKTELATANSLSATTWSFNFTMGFAAGGVLAALFGRDTVFVLNALSFAVSALLIRRIRFTEPHAENLPPLRIRDLFNYSPLREGINYVRRDPRLRATIFVKSGMGLLGANWVLLPIFGERIFPVHISGFGESRAGMLGMSVLMACRGVGAVIGPLIGGYWTGSSVHRMRIGILFGFVLAGCGYLLLGIAPNLTLACCAVVLAYCGGSTLWVYSSILLQSQTEDRYRGRVFSVEFALGVVVMAASSYLAGLLIDHGAPVARVAIFGAIAMTIPAIAWGSVLMRWKDPEATSPAE